MRTREGRDNTVMIEYEKGVTGRYCVLSFRCFLLGSFFLEEQLCAMQELMMFLLLRRLFRSCLW